jgi:Ca2+/H+ antiporter, TMEM165/GDT1 family
MNGFLYALIACFLAGCGARDQVLVAALTQRLGPRFSLLALGCLSGALTCALAAFAAQDLAGMMNHKARMLLAGFALAAAGVESLLIAPGRQAKEPTRSLFAALLVLLLNQVVDAARFIVMAIALACEAPVWAALGGTAGGAAAMAVGWFGAGALLEAGPHLRLARRCAGGVLLLSGIALGLWVMHII